MLASDNVHKFTEDMDMSRSILTKMVGAALLAGAAVPAMAQESRPIGLSLRAGLFLPTDRGLRDVGDSWFAAGLDYRLRDFGVSATTGQQTSLTLSLDYASKSGFRTVPILVNYQIRRNELYFFGGIGLSATRIATAGGSDDKTRFAYQLGVGYDFQRGNTPLFVEGKFLGNERSELNGFGVFVGVRF